jgi:hypothetical protein
MHAYQAILPWGLMIAVFTAMQFVFFAVPPTTSRGTPVAVVVPPPPILIALNHSSLAAQNNPQCYHHYNTSSMEFQTQIRHDLRIYPWSDFDWTVSQSICGANKCFYASASNATQGYLVATDLIRIYPSMLRSVRIEELLSEQVQAARVLSLSPPTLLHVPSQVLLCVLADRTYQPTLSPKSQLPIFVPHANLSFVDGESPQKIVVQRVQRAPEPHLYLGWFDHTQSKKRQLTLEQLPDFVNQHVVDRKAFLEQLTLELTQYIPQALQLVPDLAMDMQAVVDAKGRIYHIDVDRVFEPWPRDQKEWALQTVQEGSQQMLELVTQLTY